MQYGYFPFFNFLNAPKRIEDKGTEYVFPYIITISLCHDNKFNNILSKMHKELLINEKHKNTFITN